MSGTIGFEPLRDVPPRIRALVEDHRTRPPGGPIAGRFPVRYDAYARILHPAEDGEHGDAPTSWADVAAAAGVPSWLDWHPRPSFQQMLVATRDGTVGGEDDRLRRWNEPELGALALDVVRDLVHVLASVTRLDDLVLALWWTGRTGDMPHRWRSAPRVRRPGREHLVFTCPLARLVQCVHEVELAWADGGEVDAGCLARGRELIDGGGALTELDYCVSPALWLPGDAAWAVTSDVDDEFTVVGGSPALIRAILDHPGIEAVEAFGAEEPPAR